ncbi:MAG: hypothetical protein MJZ29_09080, partial [Bacteroidaceae bacterium]|nr:hypothetical protein [Bacteroidaceae bacterium]
FHYAMWVKMNLFYQQAAEAFGQEEFFSEVSIKSPLEILGEKFTREEFHKAAKTCGFKSDPNNLISQYKRRGKLKDLEKDRYVNLVHSFVHSFKN